MIDTLSAERRANGRTRFETPSQQCLFDARWRRRRYQGRALHILVRRAGGFGACTTPVVFASLGVVWRKTRLHGKLDGETRDETSRERRARQEVGRKGAAPVGRASDR